MKTAKEITKRSTLLATIRSEFPKSTAIDLEKELYEMINKALMLGGVVDILPSDEEIKEMMTTSHYHYETGHYRKVRLDRIQGAKMMRDLIKEKLIKKYEGQPEKNK